jgi:nitrogen regulatory protein PII
MHLVVCVLSAVDKCPDVLDAWEEAGVAGITILESTGMGQVRRHMAYRDDLPLMPSLVELFRGREVRHRTFFTLVQEEAMVDRLIAATEAIVGDMNKPDNGILFVLPVSRAHGLRPRKPAEDAG